MRTAANRFAASLTVLLLALSSSCSEPREQESASSQEPVGAKAAASITEYIDLMLREDDDMDPNQRIVLEKARGNGGSISQGDYVAAWMAYRQCMVDKGYANPPLHRVNGIYLGTVKTSSSGMSEAQTRKLDDDLAYCQTYHVSSVDVIYRMNIGNPQLCTAIPMRRWWTACTDMIWFPRSTMPSGSIRRACPTPTVSISPIRRRAPALPPPLPPCSWARSNHGNHTKPAAACSRRIHEPVPDPDPHTPLF